MQLANFRDRPTNAMKIRAKSFSMSFKQQRDNCLRRAGAESKLIFFTAGSIERQDGGRVSLSRRVGFEGLEDSFSTISFKLRNDHFKATSTSTFTPKHQNNLI